jgi:hypothetical protein
MKTKVNLFAVEKDFSDLNIWFDWKYQLIAVFASIGSLWLWQTLEKQKIEQVSYLEFELKKQLDTLTGYDKAATNNRDPTVEKIVAKQVKQIRFINNLINAKSDLLWFSELSIIGNLAKVVGKAKSIGSFISFVSKLKELNQMDFCQVEKMVGDQNGYQFTVSCRLAEVVL